MTKNLPKSVKNLCTFILIAMFFVTVLSVFAFSKLQTHYSLKQFLPKQNPLLALDAKTKRTFQISESQPFIVALKLNEQNSTWLEEYKIELLKQTTENIEKFDGVKNTTSLATVEGAINSKQSLRVGPLLESIPEPRWSEMILQNPLLTPALISRDAQTVSIIVNIKDLDNTQIHTLKQRISAEIPHMLPFAAVEIGGTPAVQSDITSLLNVEIRNFVILGFVACLVVLAVVFQNWAPIVASFVIIIVANIIILAVLALMGFSFNVLSTTIPILVTVDIISLCIHTLMRYIEESKLNSGKPHYRTVLDTIKVMLTPNLIASLTTMVGFLSLLTTKVPLIENYGLSAGIAIFVSWVVCSILFIPLMILMPAPVARKWAWAKARWGLYFFRQSGAWALAIIVISLALAIKGQKLSWTAKLFDDLPTNHSARSSTELIDRELGGMIPIDIELKGPEDIWNDPQLLARLDHLLREYRIIPGVGSAVGLPDLVVASNLTQGRLPASKASTAEIFFLYSLSSHSPLKNYLSTDSTRTRLAIRAQDLPGDELHQLVGQLQEKAQDAFPQFKVTITGMGSTIHELNNELSKELIFGFWQAMLVIFVILAVVFKSVRWALVACIPNLVPPAALLGFLALSQTPIKPSVAIIFSIALGMAFNNTVYLLQRLRSLQFGKRVKNFDIEKTLWLEGNPCLISSLILLAGFSVFLASYFAMNRVFGFYMILSMLAGLVGDLILLPTLLKSCPWLLSTKAGPEKESIAMKTAAMILMTFFISIPGSTGSAQSAGLPTVEKIGQELSSRLNTQDEEFTVKMTIIENDNTTKDREMKIQRLSPKKEEHYVLVRMEKPKDLRGTALLATLKGGKEEKWLYLPSNKQTRRLSGGSNDSGGILGSELSAEDFEINTERAALNKVMKSVDIGGKKYYVIESDVGTSSEVYSKVLTYISAKDYLPLQSECFDKQGKKLKVLTFSDYKKVGNNKWRAGTIKIKNVQSSRGTNLFLSNIKVNQGLKSSNFTPKVLGED